MNEIIQKPVEAMQFLFQDEIADSAVILKMIRHPRRGFEFILHATHHDFVPMTLSQESDQGFKGVAHLRQMVDTLLDSAGAHHHANQIMILSQFKERLEGHRTTKRMKSILSKMNLTISRSYAKIQEFRFNKGSPTLTLFRRMIIDLENGSDVEKQDSDYVRVTFVPGLYKDYRICIDYRLLTGSTTAPGRCDTKLQARDTTELLSVVRRGLLEMESRGHAGPGVEELYSIMSDAILRNKSPIEDLLFVLNGRFPL